MAAELANITLGCKDCNAEFVFDVEQQEYFLSKGYDNQPTRCKDCRTAKKASHNNSRGGFRNNSGPRTCYNCGQEGHVATGCTNERVERERPERTERTERSYTRNNVARGTCFNCGQDGHMSSACPNKDSNDSERRSSRPVSCFNCGQPGHRSNECSQPPQERSSRPPGACFSCGEAGHRSFECPTGQGNNSRGGYSRPSRGRGGSRPSGPRACYNCQSVDHLSYECPTKAQ